MEEDAENMRLPNGEMPPVGGRLAAIGEELIEGGLNLSEELAEEAKAQESLGETKEPAKPQTKDDLLLLAIESNQKITRAILKAIESKGSSSNDNRNSLSISTVATNSSEAREPFKEKYMVKSITEAMYTDSRRYMSMRWPLATGWTTE